MNKPLAIYYANFGDDPSTAFVPVARAKTERGARRLLRAGLEEQGYWESDHRDYIYTGIVRQERMHDHHGEDRCPGRDCLGPECTYVDDEDPTHGPGCPLAVPCPRPLDVHRFSIWPADA